jgi:hypothetical protein
MRASKVIRADLTDHMETFEKLFEDLLAQSTGLVEAQRKTCEPNTRPDIQTTICALTQMTIERAVAVGVKERGGLEAGTGGAAEAMAEAICAVGSGVGAFMAGLPPAATGHMLHMLVRATVAGQQATEAARAAGEL